MKMNGSGGGSPTDFYSGKMPVVRPYASRFYVFQMGIDLLISISTLFLLAFLRDGVIHPQYTVLGIITVLLMWFIYNSVGVYQSYVGPLESLLKMLKAWGVFITFLFMFAFITKTSTLFSRHVFISWIIVSIILQLMSHVSLPKLITQYREISTGDQKALVIGANSLGKFIAESVNGNPWMPQNVIGVADYPHALANCNFAESYLYINIEDILDVIKERDIRNVYLALPIGEAELIKVIVEKLRDLSIDVHWAPNGFGEALVNPHVREISGIPLLSLASSPLNGIDIIWKEIADKFITIVSLILLFPLMLGVAIIIKLTSRGPVFFKQKRQGWNGEIFDIWKFRSMRSHGEKNGVITQATADDPRVTAIGGFIRKTSIDELPQLFNVLTGKMSLVGPRPHAVEHDYYYSEQIRTYFNRQRVKPGLTGWAQVNGFRGETNELYKMEMRVKYDIEYINNWSVWLDLKILFKTIFVILGKNAY